MHIDQYTLNLLNNQYVFCEHDFIYGDNALNVRIWNGNGFDFKNALLDCSVMMQVIETYLKEFDSALLQKGHLDVANCPVCQSPITLYSKHNYNRVILLHTQILKWSQICYQLSHELTHLFIGGNKEDSNNWFYESIAELASNYFISKMSESFSKSSFPYFKTYAASFKDYLNDTPLARSSPIENPSSWLSEHEAELLNNKTNRDLNAQCAKLLLPYFESNSGIWNILLLAPHENVPLIQLLEHWKDSCKVYNLDRHILYFQHIFDIADK